MMDVLPRTMMKAAPKRDEQCELHDSVNHLKVERMKKNKKFKKNQTSLETLVGRCRDRP